MQSDSEHLQKDFDPSMVSMFTDAYKLLQRETLTYDD